MPVFNKINPKQNFPELEGEITQFWKDNNIFQKSIDQKPKDNKYVFYDGPPFITGTPHYGSLLPSIAKDVVPRYWTMEGKRVERKWGWDCHGLPIENKVEAKLGLKNRRDIETYGIQKFVDECYAYTRETSAEWEWYIDKIGRWVDFDNSYKTMDQDYMETVIWVFKQLWDKDYVYKGTRVSLFCTRCGTPVSNFEIAMDNSYEDMEDPAVTVKFPITSENLSVPELEGASIIAWTTTPWTLPSNRALVVDNDEDYSVVELKRTLTARKGVMIFLIDKEANKVLVLRNNQKMTSVPEGGIEEGETPEEAVKREVLEETGYKDINIIKNIGEADYLVKSTLYDLVHKQYEVFIAELNSKEKVKPTKPDNESNQPVWISLDNLERSMTWQSAGKFSRQVQDFYTGKEIETMKVTEDSKLRELMESNNLNERIVMASKRIEPVLGNNSDKYKILKTFKGSELEGLSYSAPFTYFEPNEKDWKIYSYQGMVSMDEGTGIVHSAPGYGEIDTQMGEEIGLTTMFAVNDEGKFISKVRDYAGMYIKDADPYIMRDLTLRDLLFRGDRIVHRYPYCYRCHTPLIQKAQPSWYIKIQALKDLMIKTNENINWVPDHLKEGRFKKGIEQAPDWGVSRSRYWATPMPIWKCAGNPEAANTKIVMVHGNGPTEDWTRPRGWQPYLLEEFEKLGIDAHGPLMPEPEFAPMDVWLPYLENEMVVDENTILIGHSSGAVAAMRYAETHKVKGLILVSGGYTDLDDETEKKSGYFDKPWNWEAIKENTEWIVQFHSKDDPYIPLTEAEFIHEKLDSEFTLFEDKGHLSAEGDGVTEVPEIVEIVKKKLQVSECEHMEVFGSREEIEERSGQKIEDLHRPKIDDITMECPKCKGIMKRIPEVLDVWMDSGSMPYAQKHYPFENKEDFENNYPADFVVEYIAQTRAWFYTMHVLSNALFESESFKNVITTGVIFGTDGRKMSKSYGNYPDPKYVLEKYGAEPLRMYLMSSKVMIGEDINFDENTIKDQLKSFIIPLWNSYSFFVTYANIHNWEPSPELLHNKFVKQDNVKFVEGEKIDTYWYKVPFENIDNKLDQWIIAKLQMTIRNVRMNMEAYNLPAAAREYPEFIQDLSKWYIRRSRDRFNQGDKQALDILYYILVEFSKLLAPFMPFITESIWQNLVAGKIENASESIHLSDMPQDDMAFIENAGKLMKQMEAVREIVRLGQNIRVESGIKVRQPLANMEIQLNITPGEADDMEKWMKELVADELNIKNISEVAQITHEDWTTLSSESLNLDVAVDTQITPELEEEGLFREIVRNVQAKRKSQKLQLEEKINVKFVTQDELVASTIKDYKDQIKEATNSTDVSLDNQSPANPQKLNNREVEIEITK